MNILHGIVYLHWLYTWCLPAQEYCGIWTSSATFWGCAVMYNIFYEKFFLFGQGACWGITYKWAVNTPVTMLIRFLSLLRRTISSTKYNLLNFIPCLSITESYRSSKRLYHSRFLAGEKGRINLLQSGRSGLGRPFVVQWGCRFLSRKSEFRRVDSPRVKKFDSSARLLRIYCLVATGS